MGKQLKKNTKKKQLEEYLKQPKTEKKVQKLTKQQQKYHKSVLNELEELQNKCLGYMVMDKYSKKPDDRLIQKMVEKEEAKKSSGTVYTDADFDAWEKSYFKKDSEISKDKKKNKNTEIY